MIKLKNILNYKSYQRKKNYLNPSTMIAKMTKMNHGKEDDSTNEKSEN